MISKLRLLLSGVFLVLALGYSQKAFAINDKPQGITVSPAYQQVSVPADSQQVPISFKIFNDKSTAQTLNLSVADFNTLDESGGLFFVGTKPNDIQKKYGLAKWVKLDQDQVTIAANQFVVVNAQVLNLPTLLSGGHYGALMLQLATDNSNTNQNINVHPIASSLLFVTKLGGDTHKLELSNVYISHNLVTLPSAVTLRFKNTGNTHLIPRGTVAIQNSSGKIFSKGIINQDSGIILPQTYRRYTVPLSNIASAAAPGKYKIIVSFRFDGIDQYRTYQQSFKYVPIAWVLIITLILFSLGYLIFWIVLKRHKA